MFSSQSYKQNIPLHQTKWTRLQYTLTPTLNIYVWTQRHRQSIVMRNFCLPLSFQITSYIRPSALPETTPVPSALKAAAVTGSECEAIVRRHFPVATSQILTFSSKDPLTCQCFHRQNHMSTRDCFMPSCLRVSLSALPQQIPASPLLQTKNSLFTTARIVIGQ